MPDAISRRDLMQLGAVGASAMLAAGRADAQDRPAYPENEKVGFAVVGIGKLAQGQIIPGFKNATGAKLAALVSGHPEKARRVAAENGLPMNAIYNYQDYDRIAADPRVQVVYVVLPNSMHAEYTIRALKAGKHVLCEKPMASTVGEGEAMVAAARAANRKLMIAYRCHYDPTNLYAMRLLRSGRMGKPRLVETDMGRQSDLNDPSDAWRLDMRMSGGGALADMGIYGINASRYLLNEEPVEVRAWSNTNRSDPRFRTVPDLIAWQFRFPSGAIANNSTSFDYEGSMDFRVFCEHGRITAQPGCFYSGNHLDVAGGPEAHPKIHEINQFAREMDWMADVVRGRRPMVSPGEEGLQDMRLIKAILDSAAQGGAPVRVDWSYRRAVDPAVAVDVPRTA